MSLPTLGVPAPARSRPAASWTRRRFHSVTGVTVEFARHEEVVSCHSTRLVYLWRRSGRDAGVRHRLLQLRRKSTTGKDTTRTRITPHAHYHALRRAITRVVRSSFIRCWRRRRRMSPGLWGRWAASSREPAMRLKSVFTGAAKSWAASSAASPAACRRCSAVLATLTTATRSRRRSMRPARWRTRPSRWSTARWESRAPAGYAYVPAAPAPAY